MWADTLLNLEQGHLQRLGLWAVASVVVGALMLLMLQRKADAGFLRHFAMQFVGWGLIDGALVAWAWNGLALRDFASATQLQKFLWLNVGLDVGYVAVGITLALTAWVLGKRLGALGAGVGVVVQGAALFVLDMRLLTMMETARIALMPVRDSGVLPV
ncbi:MAG: hypothetical protein H7Z40_04425 [Phycisphaerae bacterium]|nr:hypothetical protein [Gemmatimonadaceae bacterium]